MTNLRDSRPGILLLLLLLGVTGGCSQPVSAPDAASAAKRDVSSSATVAPSSAKAPRPSPSASPSGPALASSASPPAPPHPGLAELKVVRQHYEAQGSRSAPFAATLRKASRHLDDIPPASGDEPLQWRKITLPEVPGAGEEAVSRPFGGFRFRSPLSEPADLYWAFSGTDSDVRWYILPDQGTMEGFKDFDLDWRVQIPEVPLIRDNTLYLQELSGGAILPGREYIIWLAGPRGRPAIDVHCALRIVPAGTHRPDADAVELARHLDLTYGYQTFPDTPEGLLAATASLSELYGEDVARIDVTRRILQPVLHRLPQAEVTADRRPPWTRVASLAPKFAALRFRSNLKVPARLVLAYVVEQEPLRWGLLPPDGYPTGSVTTHLEVNCPLPETVAPAENLAVFATLPHDAILPGQEYVLWFSSPWGILPPFDVSLGLIAETDESLPATTAEIARTLGLSLPESVSPDRIAAALRRCQSLVREERTEGLTFRWLLDFVRPSLPPLFESEKPSSWSALRPGPDEPQFAAFRVDVPESSQLICGLASGLKDDLRWGFVEEAGHVWGNAASAEMIRHDVRLEGVALPETNTLLLESGVAGSGPRGRVFFVSAARDNRLEAWLKGTASPAPAGGPPRDFAETAKHLGLHLERAVPFGKRVATLETSLLEMSFLNPRELAASGADGVLRVLDIQTGKAVRESAAAPGETRITDIDRTGGRIVVRDSGMVATVYDASLQPLSSIPLSSTSRHTAFAFFHGGERLAGFFSTPRSVYGQELSVWNAGTGELLESRRFGSEAYLVDVCGTSAHGPLVVSLMDRSASTVGSRTDDERRFLGRISFLDAQTFEETRIFAEPGAVWTHCRTSADGTRLFGLEDTGLLRWWAIPPGDLTGGAGQPLGTFISLEQPKGMSVSADGRVVATLAQRGAIQVWDVARARLLAWWMPDGALPTSLALSPDGRTLAIGSDDQQLWTAEIPVPLEEANPDACFGVLTDSIGVQLVHLPAGRFPMGSLDSKRYPNNRTMTQPNQKPQRVVTISKPFRIGAHEITVGQFRKFVEATGYKTSAETSGRGGSHFFPGEKHERQDVSLTWKNPGFEQADDHPVVQVSLRDAEAFCTWLSAREKAKYRLPTEAEWEYASRGGTDTLLPGGDFVGLLERTANVADRSYLGINPAADWTKSWEDGFGNTAPVGSLIPNGFGLYDMIGNVWEWCSDYYDPAYYTYGPAVDPPGPPSGKSHSQRGCGFTFHASMAYSAFRDHGRADSAQSVLGFRVVREIPAP